jgi:hypothetical protein
VGYTREQRAANAKKKAEADAKKNNTKESVVEKEVETTKIKSAPKRRLKLDDDVLLSVKSNVFGRLVYINHKNSDETQWEEYGEIQPLSVGDLRAMKAKQPDFFKENWITIVGVESADDDYDNVDMSEIYDALMISQYYQKSECPNDLNEVFAWSVNEIKEKLPKMTSSVKTSIIIRANELIIDGSLDSISKVKAIEEALNCSLASPED